MRDGLIRVALIAAGVVFAATALAPGAATAGSKVCREWRAEHREWKTKALRLYLTGAGTRDLDTALFEMLQRESYLTSCEAPVQIARAEMVGWRLVGRTPDDYGSAVAESVLVRAGFDLGLRSLFGEVPPTAETAAASGSGPER